MRVLSLFDGIGCGRVALERAGIKVDSYDAYEIEPNAIRVATVNWPDIVEKGDVFKAEYKKGQYDLLIGGSPCTFWSISGARGVGKGKRETTSSGFGFELFMQYYRALKETETPFFLYENNESMSDEIKNEITKYLGVEPFMIDSADFSAQHRKRYYWTNIPVSGYDTKSPILFKDIEYQGDHRICDFSKYINTQRISDNGKTISWDTSGKGNYSQQNRARRTDQKWNTLPSSGSDKNNIWLGDCRFRKIHPIEAERLQCLPDNYTACLKSSVKRIEVCGNGWTVDVISHILKGLK